MEVLNITTGRDLGECLVQSVCFLKVLKSPLPATGGDMHKAGEKSAEPGSKPQLPALLHSFPLCQVGGQAMRTKGFGEFKKEHYVVQIYVANIENTIFSFS